MFIIFVNKQLDIIAKYPWVCALVMGKYGQEMSMLRIGCNHRITDRQYFSA